MISNLHDLFSNSLPMLLFTIIGLGYFIGHLKIFGFQLNVAAVLFVGIAFGAWDPKGFRLPDELYILGLVLFVYTIGIQSGPMFFNIFKERGLKLNLLAFLSLTVALGVAFLLKHLFQIPNELLTGIFTGSLTNTAALAAGIDCIRGSVSSGEISSQTVAIAEKLAAPPLGYSIACPFGVIGVMLTMQLVIRLFKVSFEKERESFQQKMSELQKMVVEEFRIANEQIFEKTVRDSRIGEFTGIVLTRIKHNEDVDLVTPETVFHKNDIVVGVGTPDNIGKAHIILGPVVSEGISGQRNAEIEYRDVFVTNREMAGKLVSDFAQNPKFLAIISRLKRGFTNLPIHSDTTVEFGDQIRVVTYSENIDRACSLFGDPIKDLSETDFLSFSLGIILGILLGMLPIPLPNGANLRLGFAGGPLIIALVLGRIGRSGPIIWTMHPNVNLAIRQLGLYLFLAGIGLKAGGDFFGVFRSHGVTLFLSGVIITLVTSLTTLFVGYKILKIEMISLLGITAGVHTQPACLAFAVNLSKSDAPNLSFVAVQPLCMILKIIFAQVIVLSF